MAEMALNSGSKPQTHVATTEERALRSKGTSGDAIYRLVGDIVRDGGGRGGLLLDVGGGVGLLQGFVKDYVDRYVVADLIRYEGLDASIEFAKVDFDTGRLPFADGSADVVTAVEVIEHLENPRAFARELVRVARPGGLIVVSTPNQLSFLSKLTLVLKNHFNAFGPRDYPAHLSALLEIDLLRIASECGLASAAVRYTNSGRIPGTPWRWPWPCRGRMFSDNVALICRR